MFLNILIMSETYTIFNLISALCAYNLNVVDPNPRERSGSVLDSRPRGHRFEPHRRHWVLVLEQDTFILA